METFFKAGRPLILSLCVRTALRETSSPAFVAMQTIAVQLQAILQRALRSLPEPLPEDFQGIVTPAADTRFGDYQANAAMVLAKARRTNPRALATQIVEALKADAALEGISAAPEIAGAGFINFRLRPEFLARELAALDADPARLGVDQPEHPLKVVIDFSGPNVAKPMHVGHLRSTIIGDCLARVARFIGHEVWTDNHLGDWGTQFGKVIYGWKNFLNRANLASDPLSELVRVYQLANSLSDVNPSLETAQQLAELRAGAVEDMLKGFVGQPGMDEAALDKMRQEATAVITEADRKQTLEIADACRAELARLQAGDAGNTAIWQQCVDLSRAELDKIYDRLHIRFDYQYGESFFNSKLAPLVARMEQSGVAEPGELLNGRRPLVVHFPEDPRLAEFPAMIRKGDGAFNYATTDVATYEQRVNEIGANTLWYVVGAPQSLHFEQLNAIARRLGYAVPLTHIPFGSVLGEDRKMLSTRRGTGNSLSGLLDEAEERARVVVDEKDAAAPEDKKLSEAEKVEITRIIGLGAVKYAEASQHRMTDYIFSWSKMLSFQGNTAPYLQNAYVRIRSIFRRGGLDPETSGDGNTLALTESAELDLAKKLAQFAEVVPTVLDDFRPNLLANYLYELAGTFHGFFEACPVLKAEEGRQRETRLTLCRVTMRTLRVGLDLLGIEVPERM